MRDTLIHKPHILPDEVVDEWSECDFCPACGERLEDDDGCA